MALSKGKANCLLDDKRYCDVSFRVGQKRKTIRAHKHILETTNHVLRDMLQGDSGEIVLSDIEPDVFDLLLRFLYRGEKCASRKTVVGLLYAAKKFEVQVLFDFCKTFLLSTLTKENVFKIMENIMEFDMTDIILECLNFVCNSSDRAKDLFISESFLKCSRDLLVNLIKADNLPLDEILVFHLVILWAKYNCAKIGNTSPNADEVQDMLGDIVYHVRFPTMSEKTFWKMVVPTGILNKDELVLITNYIFENRKDCPGFDSVKRSGHRMVRFLERFKAFFGLWITEDTLDARVFWNVNGAAIL